MYKGIAVSPGVVVGLAHRVDAVFGPTEPQMLDDPALVPAEGEYEHNRLNYDSNSHAHQRASIVGASQTVPVSGGRLATGTWQQIVLVDFDDRPRERTVLVQVLS